MNIGKAPHIKAKVVSPKENPGLPGKTSEIATKVIGMVILNKNIPKIPRKGLPAHRDRSNEEMTKEETPTFIHPNLSANNPPRLFPKKTPKVKKTMSKKFDFQGKTMTDPTKARIATESNKNKMISSKMSMFFALFPFL